MPQIQSFRPPRTRISYLPEDDLGPTFASIKFNQKQGESRCNKAAGYTSPCYQPHPSLRQTPNRCPPPNPSSSPRSSSVRMASIVCFTSAVNSITSPAKASSSTSGLSPKSNLPFPNPTPHGAVSRYQSLRVKVSAHLMDPSIPIELLSLNLRIASICVIVCLFP